MTLTSAQTHVLTQTQAQGPEGSLRDVQASRPKSPSCPTALNPQSNQPSVPLTESSSNASQTLVSGGTGAQDTLWNYSIQVPKSKNCKLIYPKVAVELPPWTREQWRQRFESVKTALETLVDRHLRLRDFTSRPTYSFRMAGSCPSDARPSVVIVCRDCDFKNIRTLFRKRAEDPLQLKNEKGSPLAKLFSLGRGHERALPPLQLVYYRTLTAPVMRSALDEPLLVHLGKGDATCGGIIRCGEKAATLGVAVDISGTLAFLTVDHLFGIADEAGGSPLSPRDHGGLSDSESPSTPSWKDPDHGSASSLLWDDDDEYEDLDADDLVHMDPPSSEELAILRKPQSARDTEIGSSEEPEVWEKVVVSAHLDPSQPYLDWALTRPLSPATGIIPSLVNTVFPDGDRSHPVLLREYESSPSSHLADVYMVSGVRGILYGQIITAPTFLPSFSSRASAKAWTVISDISGGLLSGECGSVVADRATNKVYGHVVGSDPLGHAYVVPLADVLHQISICLGNDQNVPSSRQIGKEPGFQVGFQISPLPAQHRDSDDRPLNNPDIPDSSAPRLSLTLSQNYEGKSDDMLEATASRLEDRDVGIRRAAAEALKQTTVREMTNHTRFRDTESSYGQNQYLPSHLRPAIGSNLSFVLNKPGDLEFQDRPIPTLKAPNEVLVAINYTSIDGADVHYWIHGSIGDSVVRDPIVLGHAASGTVVEIGEGVETLKIGDRVALEPGFPCLHCGNCAAGHYNLCPDIKLAGTPPWDGTLTGYLVAPVTFCHRLPSSISLEEGALIETLARSVHIIRQAQVTPGRSVVVMGAGPVGLLCAAVARSFGATKVIQVDITQNKLDFALAFAATHVYLSQRVSAEQNARNIIALAGLGSGADVVIDASGAEPAIQASVHTVRPGGTYVQGGVGKINITFPITALCLKEVTARGSLRYGNGDFKLAIELVATGKVHVMKLVNGVVPFEQAEAFKKIKEGQVIKMVIAGPNESGGVTSVAVKDDRVGATAKGPTTKGVSTGVGRISARSPGRHLPSSLEGLVTKALRGFVTYNHRLKLDETNRIIFDSEAPRSNVSIISGGSSGHEPPWSGYVGRNMLAASVAGDIFASPTSKQVLAAIEAVPSHKGTLLVITNNTSDCLNFGLAVEKARGKGLACRMLICGDNVSIGKTSGPLVGRRGLVAQIAVLKILGAAGAQGASLDELYDLGVAICQQIVSIDATLDHYHKNTVHATLKEDESEIGTEPRSEPGYQKLSPIPVPLVLVNQLLAYCLDQSGSTRSHVKFNPGDETVLLVSNSGAISNLELGGLVDELLQQMSTYWNLEPVRVYSGCLGTSPDAIAFSVSVINLTAIAANSSYTIEEIKSFLDLQTDTAWEAVAGFQSYPLRKKRAEQLAQPLPVRRWTVGDSADIKVEPALLEMMVRTACEAVIAAEPDLTKWDTVMGDGDCGLTLQAGATALLDALDSTGVTAKGSVVEVLIELEDIAESKMGGTLCGILGIFIAALRTAIEANSGLAKTDGIRAVWAKALASAIAHLRYYTPARVGDRTVMDTLIPFSSAMEAGKTFRECVAEAIKGAEATRTLRPGLGRAAYVSAGAESSKELPPDPGAWGVMVAIKGLLEGMDRVFI